MNAPAMKNLAAPAIRLHPNDSVLVARIDLAQGSILADENLSCLNRVTRVPVPASHITVGLQCGGSAFGCKPAPSIKLEPGVDLDAQRATAHP